MRSFSRARLAALGGLAFELSAYILACTVAAVVPTLYASYAVHREGCIYARGVRDALVPALTAAAMAMSGGLADIASHRRYYWGDRCGSGFRIDLCLGAEGLFLASARRTRVNPADIWNCLGACCCLLQTQISRLKDRRVAIDCR